MNSITPQITEQAAASLKTYPVEGTNLDKILSNPTYRETFHRQLKGYNPWIVALYKIGLLHVFGFNQKVMLLTTKGRKSGKLRSTPIGYFNIGGVIHLFSAWGKAANWYKNLAACPEDVWIQIGMRRWHVQPVVINDPDEMMQTIVQLTTEAPEKAQYLFGWDPDHDRLDQADFSSIIQHVLVVKFIER